MKKSFFLSALLLSASLYANTLEEIMKQKEVRIALSTMNHPFSSMRDGEFVGFEVDLAKKIGEKLVGDGGKVTLVGLNNPTQKVEFLNNNVVDIVISNFLKTPKLDKEVDFAMPYFSVGIAALTKTDNKVKNITELKNIAIKKGFSPAIDACAKMCPKDTNILEVKDNNEGYDLMKKGKVDAYLNTDLVVMGYPIFDNNVEVKHKIGKKMFLSPGVKKGNQELVDAINKIMFSLSKEGYFRSIYEKTFGKFYKDSLVAEEFLLEDLYSTL